MRVVSKQQDADRRAAYAVADCDDCAAAIVKMSGPGFTAWRRKHTTLPRKVCAKKAPRRQDPPGDPGPAPSVLLDREPYIVWLQRALSMERAESNRLRRALGHAKASLDRAMQRPADNDPGPAPKAHRGAMAASAPPKVVAAPKPDDGDLEAGADFDTTLPLAPNEQALLRALAPTGRITTADAHTFLPRRSAYSASLRLKRRGFITIHADLLGDVRGSIYALTPSGREALHGHTESINA